MNWIKLGSQNTWLCVGKEAKILGKVRGESIFYPSEYSKDRNGLSPREYAHELGVFTIEIGGPQYIRFDYESEYATLAGAQAALEKIVNGQSSI